MSNYEENLRYIREAVIEIVKTAKPNISGFSGIELQTMNPHDYMELLRKEIIRQVEEELSE